MSLRDDLRMYFGGSFIGFIKDGEPRAMHVGDITYKGDGDKLEQYSLHGTVYRAHGNKGRVVSEDDVGSVKAKDVINFPKSGYYSLNGTVRYVEFSLTNRTNRKGLESNRVLADGQSGICGSKEIASLFLNQPFAGQLGVSRDWHLDSGNNIHFRGQHIGLVENKQPVLNDSFKYLEAPLCKLLDRFYEQLP